MAYEVKEFKIHASEVTLGMEVVRLDRPWEETNFLLQGFVVKHPDEITDLINQCEYVYIAARQEITKADLNPHKPSPRAPVGKPVAAEGLDAARKQGFRYVNKVDIREEAAVARETYKEAKETVSRILDDIRLGRPVNMAAAREAVTQIVDSVLRNSDALLLLSKLKHKDSYTAEHCLNVSILAATFGRHLGLLEDEIYKVALGGFLHDIGKAQIDPAIINKPGQLNAEEFREIQKHPEYGRDLLVKSRQAEFTTVDVAYCHHERIDGLGYPRGLSSEKIPHFAKIVGLCDVYDAVTTHRSYNGARASMEALDIIHRGKGRQFDNELAIEFIRCIGIYPPGSVVQLSSGEVGIVVEANAKNKLKPKVLLVRDAEKRPRTKYRMIDLINLPKDEKGEVYTLAKEVPDGSFGISLKAFIDKGLVLGGGVNDQTR